MPCQVLVKDNGSDALWPNSLVGGKGSIDVDECRMNEIVVTEKIMIISRCSSPVQEQVAMGMRPNTTPLSEMYLHLWREVFCQFSETESV